MTHEQFIEALKQDRITREERREYIGVLAKADDKEKIKEICVVVLQKLLDATKVAEEHRCR